MENPILNKNSLFHILTTMCLSECRLFDQLNVANYDRCKYFFFFLWTIFRYLDVVLVSVVGVDETSEKCEFHILQILDVMMIMRL